MPLLIDLDRKYCRVRAGVLVFANGTIESLGERFYSRPEYVGEAEQKRKTYSLRLEITTTDGSSSDKWEVKLDQFAFNQSIDENSFNVEGS